MTESVAQPQPQPTSQANSAASPKDAMTIVTKNKKLFLTILIILGVMILVKAVFFKSAVISVIGVGKLTAKPAKVEMLVTRVDSNPDPILAIMAGEESVNRITTKTKELVGEDVEIQKSFYQVTPSVVTGDVLYQVVNIFKITANDPTRASDLIKGFYTSGATTVSGVNFIPENKDQVLQDARKEAIKDARQQAKNIARASGKILGRRIVSIGDDLSKGSSTVSTDGAAQNGEDTAVQVNSIDGVPTEIDISKSMTVTYEIW